MKKRRFITLIEMMIVMFLIALITGVIAYNYRGSLEQGKAFKTQAGIERLETILNLSIAEDPTLQDHIEANWREVIRRSPLVQNPDALMKDGWGVEYQVSMENNAVRVSSSKYQEYQHTQRNPTRS